MNSLEVIEGLLPSSINFHPHLDATEDGLFTSPEVDTQLDHIAIIDGPWPGFHVRRRKADMIQKGATAALHILDIPLMTFAPKFAMSPTHDLRLEAHGGRGGSIWSYLWRGLTLAVTANLDNHLLVWKRARYGREGQRRSRRSRVVVRYETDRGKIPTRCRSSVSNGSSDGRRRRIAKAKDRRCRLCSIARHAARPRRVCCCCDANDGRRC